MSQTLAAPTFTASLRRAWRRAWDDPDSRSTIVGVAGVIVVYLLLWMVAPHLLRGGPPRTFKRTATPPTFNIEITPEMFAKPAPKPPPFKFVETNPDAPENMPDKTNNFGAQNQQVAQEKPTLNGKSDRPATEGKKDFESTQIVDGHLSQPVENTEAVPPPADTKVAETTVAAPKLEQNPLPGTEKLLGENPDGVGTNISKTTENVRSIPEKIEGVKNVPLVEGATSTQVAIDPQHPRPRPQVVKQQNTRPAIFAENKFGTSNIGLNAYDAKWSNYGAYLQRMIDTIQIQWERILVESSVSPPSGTMVTVTFIIESEGRIARIVTVDNKSSDQGGRACVSGITDRSPYGPWSDDMKAMLGDQQQMTFSFYYQ